LVPLNDNNPTRITPFVTYALITINVLVFLHEMQLTPEELNEFFRTWAVVPAQLTAAFRGEAPLTELVTLITSQFLHGGLLHLGGNMLYLFIFGNNIEEKLGRFRYIIFYLACGVLASLAQWMFSQGSEIPALGASGAIAGVMGAYIIRFPKARILTLLPIFFYITVIRIPAYVFLGLWFIQQAFYGVASLGVSTNVGMESGGIAYWAHAGGFVAGALLGPMMGLFSDTHDRNRYY
jgi:membrane associated rhomboid family serine protease